MPSPFLSTFAEDSVDGATRWWSLISVSQFTTNSLGYLHGSWKNEMSGSSRLTSRSICRRKVSLSRNAMMSNLQEFAVKSHLWRKYSNLNLHYHLVDDQRWGQTPFHFPAECRNPWLNFDNCSFVCRGEIASFFAWDRGSWRGFSSKLVETLSTREFQREPSF